MPKNPEKTAAFGRGLDIGTMNLIAAQRVGDAVQHKRMRDAFLALDLSAKKMLKLTGADFVEREEELLILGDAALNLANVFGQEARRPLDQGLISAGEIDALEVLGIMIKSLLGEPSEVNEVCCFSVPAPPRDAPDRDIIYHQGVFEQIVSECGYDAIASNEAMAIVYSECAPELFSGLSFSFGCLTPEVPIITRRGLVPISSVKEGEEVLTRAGVYSRVAKTWTREHEGLVFQIRFEGNPDGVTLTGNHRVWVQKPGGWSWVAAEDLQKGDIIGEPVISGYGRRRVLGLKEKTANGLTRSKNVDWSMKMGRFLGYFLADGHLGPEDRNTIWFDFGPDEQEFVDDLAGIADGVLNRSVSVSQHGNALRCQMSHKSLCRWLRKHCYTEEGSKSFPLNIEDLRPGVVEGILVGLIRGDGWSHHGEHKSLHLSNTSPSLIIACHLLLGRMGLTSTVTRRDPRGSTFKDGREISPENCKSEWAVHVTGIDGQYLYNIIHDYKGERRAPRVWKDGGFRCTKIREVTAVSYEGPVHDLTIDGDPSFCAPYITMHNSGMTNVALAVNTIEGLTFSVARGGDWIDGGAAKSLGTTRSRMCGIKEQGLDLMNPQGREQKALALYYKSLINYVIGQVGQQFKAVAGRFEMPTPIPIVLSGGTSLAGGFRDFFEQVFKQQRRFPIPISEIRMAADPLNAVANGLLVQAMQEYAD